MKCLEIVTGGHIQKIVIPKVIFTINTADQ